jgi:hypothetical protein
MSRRIPNRWIRVAGLLVVIAAVAALGHQLLVSSSSTAGASSDVVRSEHRGALDKALPRAVWLAHGPAAVQIDSRRSVPARTSTRLQSRVSRT